MSNETGEGYKPPGAENWEAPKTGDQTPEGSIEMKSLKKQVEEVNQQYREYDKSHPELNLSAETFSINTLGKIRHAVENIEDGDGRSKGIVAEFSRIVNTLTTMTPEQQKSIDYDKKMNPASYEVRQQEFAQFRKKDTDTALTTFLIDRMRLNGIPSHEIDNAERIAGETGVRTDRADRILSELGKYRSIDKNFLIPRKTI